MQIELLGYEFDTSKVQGLQTRETQMTYRKTSDGYSIVENPTIDPTVIEIEAFLVRVAQTNLNSLNLAGAEFNTQNNVMTYRLRYEIIGLGMVQIIEV